MQQDRSLAEAANQTWQIASQIHERQTAKDANVNGRVHVESVEENIWRLLNDTIDHSLRKNLDNFSPVDLYLLSCAACCHDFDKGLQNSVLPADFKHGEGSGDFVNNNWQRLSIRTRAAAEYIDRIVRIHTAQDDFDRKLQEIPDSYTLLNHTGDLRRLATLLKAADTLHMDESRIANVAVPDDSLQGFDRLKQIARENIHGWRPDGERIIITVSVKSQETMEALKGCEHYVTTKEWPQIGRNLRACGFPHKIEFDWLLPPPLLDILLRKSTTPSEGLEVSLDRIMIELPASASINPALIISDTNLKLIAVPPEGLMEYLAEVGPLTVIDNDYIEPKLTEIGSVAGAVNRIFIGPANCGKTRAACEWIRRKVGIDDNLWVVIRPACGSIPQDASKFILDHDDFYREHKFLPNKAILFADDLPEYLPPAGSGTDPSEAVNRLLSWFERYPGVQDRCFVGTMRSERMHDKSGWPDRLIELGKLRIFRVEPFDEPRRRHLWKGMCKGRTFGKKRFEKLNVKLDAEFLDAVAPIEADPEAIAYYVLAQWRKAAKGEFRRKTPPLSTPMLREYGSI
jgi:hypothetical protein